MNPINGYIIDARYDKMMEAFGAKGTLVRTPDELTTAVKDASSADGPVLINILIDPKASPKPQKFAWLTN